MASITTKITGDTKVAGFVDVYNSNNEKLETEIQNLKEKIEQLQDMYNKKVDKVSLNTLIRNEVIRTISTDYSSQNPFGFVRVGDVKDIVNDLLK